MACALPLCAGPVTMVSLFISSASDGCYHASYAIKVSVTVVCRLLV